MTKVASIRLTDRFERFVTEQTASGRYASLDEVVEAGLNLLQREAELEVLDFGPAPTWTRDALEKAIREGEESGDPQEVDFSRLLREVVSEVDGERMRRG